MISINLFDTNFAHSKKIFGFDTASLNRRNPNIEYTRYGLTEYNGISMFTDIVMFSEYPDKVKSNYKIGWMLESPAVSFITEELMEKIEDKFDFILTHNKNLVKQNGNKYKYLSVANCWVNDSDIGLQSKTKLISHIVSNKTNTIGHKLRHTIKDRVAGLDIYGVLGRFSTKVLPHKDYKYSIVVENIQSPGYFTEKLIDCICQGCVPIYWGDPLIGEVFDTRGMIIFNSLEELQNIKLTKDDYENRIKYIKKNLEISRNFLCIEDNMYNLILNEQILH